MYFFIDSGPYVTQTQILTLKPISLAQTLILTLKKKVNRNARITIRYFRCILFTLEIFGKIVTITKTISQNCL